MPTLMAQCGMPWRKLVVPSSGSTTHRHSQSSPPLVPLSSMRKAKPGRARDSSRRSVSSAKVSAWDTKSPGPFTLTWSFSVSPKSRSSRRPTLCTALTTALSAGESRGEDMAAGVGVSALGPLHVGRVLGLHHDLFAAGDERRNHGLDGIGEHRRLVGGRGGLPLHHGVRFR